MGMGEGGLGMGVWGLGIGPNPQSPFPNPQSPIPNPQVFLFKIYINKNESRKEKYESRIYHINKRIS